MALSSDLVSDEHHDTPDVSLVIGVDGALRETLVFSAQGPVPVTLDEASDDSAPAERRVTDRDQAAVCAAGASGSIQT